MTTTTYKYGCLPPTSGADLVVERMKLARRYSNALVEVELARRDLTPPLCPCAVQSVATTEPGDWPACTCEACRDAKAKKPGAQHCSKTDATWAFARSMAMTHAQTWSYEHQRRLRKRNGLYWGTYLLCEQAADAQRKEIEDPNFRPWNFTGRIGVQLQNGLSVATALAGTDTRLHLRQLPDPPGMTPGSRRSGHRYEVDLRVGSNRRKPVWATFPCILHRPLPPKGKIMWAVVRANRVGPVAVDRDGKPRLRDLRWSLLLTVRGETAQRDDTKADAERTGTMAIDLGWRVQPDGLRVGYWVDDAGKQDEIVMPVAVQATLEHARSIVAIRRRNANNMQTRLVAWREEHAAELPEWFVEATATLAQWKSCNRLARLAERWRDRRFSADASIYPEVDTWRRQDRHLYQWEANETNKTLARRDDQYRCWAADFARRYRTIVIEDFHLPAVAGRRGLKRNATDGEKVFADNASSRRHIAAPGTFRGAVLDACRSRGTVVMERECAFTTLACSKCGYCEPWDAAPAIDHCCAKCGAIWDQDYNAAVNLLRGTAGASGPVLASSPRPLEGGMSERQKRFRGGRKAKPSK
jgi:hypothetical protein